MAVLLSIICPVYTEALCVPLFYGRLMTALEPVKDRIEIEPMVMNNRSTDGTADEVRRLRAGDRRVPLLTFYLARTYRNGVGLPIAIIDWRASATSRDANKGRPS